MSFAPRIAERLLEALCPPSEFRDGIVGDLSEEYLDRRLTEGPFAARIWYYGQALASAPHLAAHAASRATLGTWARVTAYSLGAMVCSRIAIVAVQVAIIMALGVVPDSTGIVLVAWRDVSENYPFVTQLMNGVPWLVSALAGCLIGRRHREAPLATACASAIAAGGIAVAFLAMAGGWPLVFRLAFVNDLVVWMLSMIAGGTTAALAMPPRLQRYHPD